MPLPFFCQVDRCPGRCWNLDGYGALPPQRLRRLPKRPEQPSQYFASRSNPWRTARCLECRNRSTRACRPKSTSRKGTPIRPWAGDCNGHAVALMATNNNARGRHCKQTACLLPLLPLPAMPRRFRRWRREAHIVVMITEAVCTRVVCTRCAHTVGMCARRWMGNTLWSPRAA